MPRLLALAALASCAPPCELKPTFTHDDGHDEIASVVEQYVLDFLSWTGPQCLSAVEVTEQAPETGEHRRERREGWTLVVHPETVYPEQINRHLCDILLREERPLKDAPKELFASETDAREDQFLRVCALGPTDQAFLKQSRACGPTLTPEERFVQEVVYDQREILAAPELPIVREEPVPIGPRMGYAYAFTATTEGLFALERERADDAYRLDRRSVVVAGTGDGIPGQLHVLSTRDGQVRSIDLPAPDNPLLTSAPRSLWPDPNRPGSLLVSYAFQYYERLDPDFIYTVSLDRFLARLDLESETWETLLRTNPWALDPGIWPLGVTGDGRWVLRIDLADGGALLGTLSAETGELAVSGSLCLEDEEYPWLVIGDTLYETGLSGDTEVWTPYRIGR